MIEGSKTVTSPVFICGYPKSGTTLLLALLDRHPELLVFPEESKFLRQVMGHPERQELDYILTETGANAFRFDTVRWPSGDRGYPAVDFSEYTDQLEERWRKSDGTERALLESVILSFGEVTGQVDRRYWVEKTPHNERYLVQAITEWPELRAIYILRDPRDNYCSYRKKRKQDARDFSPENLCTGWCNSVHSWEQFAAHNANTLLIRYGDLVRYPRAVMQRICDFLQIDWDDILLKPTRNGVFWSGNSMHNAKFEGISTASLGKYHDLLTMDEVHFLETWLGRVMVRYGWHLESEPAAFPQAIRDLLSGGRLISKLRMVRSLLKVHWPLI